MALSPLLSSSETSCALVDFATDSELSPSCSLTDVHAYAFHSPVLHQHGYQLLHKMHDTLQGEIWKALHTKSQSYVAIKKCSKVLYRDGVSQEDDSFLCVGEDIVKEAMLLRYLTNRHTPIGRYIVEFVDMVQDDEYYYLIMEYVPSECNWKEFILMCKAYVNRKELSLADYQSMMKYLNWQLMVTVEWLHTMKCCHLDLCLENIMLCNASFIEHDDGHVTIHPAISIKLCDFGVAEMFAGSFECEKTGLSIYNEGYYAPKVFAGEIYDAAKADVWSLGMILFESMTIGRKLYKPMSMHDDRSGYQALLSNRLVQYLNKRRLLRFFSSDALRLLQQLLQVKESHRIDGMAMLQSRWFAAYFDRYQSQLGNKYKRSKKASSMKKLKHLQKYGFPFYK